jgi:WD repeat-containing protein 61
MVLHPLFTQNAHNGALYALAWDERDGKLYSGGADRIIAVWSADLGTQEPLTIRTTATIYSLLFVPSNRLLFVGLSDGALHVIDVDRKQEVAAAHVHSLGIFDLAYDPLHHWVWSAGGDGWLNVWHADSGDKIRSIPFAQSKIRQIKAHPTLPLMAVAGDQLQIIDTEFANVQHTLVGHDGAATALCWHPMKSILFSGGKDGHLMAWAWSQSEQAALRIPAHRFAIYRLLMDASNGMVISASRDGTIKVWNEMNMDHLSSTVRSSHAHTHSINALVACDGGYFSASDDRKIIRWELGMD